MLFEGVTLGNLRLPNRLVRSATYEGMADETGAPEPGLADLYGRLAANDVGMIVTGFCFIAAEGRASQPRQCGMDAEHKVAPWSRIVAAVKDRHPGTALVMQLAHAGRQTLASAAGGRPVGASSRPSPFFGGRPRSLRDAEISAILRAFADAADRARRAGFDGVQLHAAHGYLIHQFLRPDINRRRDRWGRDRDAFLLEAIRAVKERCGDRFPVLLKVSARDGVLEPEDVGDLLRRLEPDGVDAVEISTGTMDRPFEIFRGGVPARLALRHNPLYKDRPEWAKRLWLKTRYKSVARRFPPFREEYNRADAAAIRSRTGLPLILVGGLRSAASMETILRNGEAEAVSLCRPLIREPDLGRRIREGSTPGSSCRNCNVCAVMCDSRRPLRCYAPKTGTAASIQEVIR